MDYSARAVLEALRIASGSSATETQSSFTAPTTSAIFTYLAKCEYVSLHPVAGGDGVKITEAGEILKRKIEYLGDVVDEDVVDEEVLSALERLNK